jgi:hypothetical protein
VAVVPRPAAPRTIESIPLEQGVQVLVRTKSTGEPVPGALVCAFDWCDYDEDLAAQLDCDSYDQEAFAEQFGRWFQADSGGLAVVPRPWRGTIVQASHAGLWGQAEIQPGAGEPVPIELVPDPELRVRVVDEDGRPVAGVRTCLLIEGENWGWPARVALSEEPGGIAVLRHVSPSLGPYPANRASIALAEPLLEVVKAALDPARWPSEPVELLLPPTGSLEIRIEDEDGALFDGVAWATLTRKSPSAAPGGEPPADLDFYLPIRGGRRLVSHVSPGVALSVSAWSQAFDALHEECAGPSRPGERVTLVLQIESPTPVLVARILRDGELVRGARLRIVQLVRSFDGTYGRSELSARTDAEGRMRLSVQGGAEGHVSRRSLDLRIRPDHGEAGPWADVELPARLERGTTDLGDIALVEPPLLVAGRVVDEAGRGIAGAGISLAAAADVSAGAGATGWIEMPQEGLSTQRDGSFEVRGTPPAGDLQVSVWHERFGSPEPRLVPVGTRDLELVLPGAGSIAGRVLAEPEVMGVGIDVLAHGADENQGNVRGASLDRATGAFEIQGLAPGPYALTAQVENGGPQLAPAADLVVEAGRVTRDPRFDPLDLRGKVRPIRIEASCADAIRLQFFQVQQRDPETLEWSDCGGWGQSGSSITVLASKATIDVVVIASEHRPLELFGISSDQRVVLEPGLGVRVVLDPPQAELGPGASLSVTASPEGEGHPPYAPVWAAFGAPGERASSVSMHLPYPGTYRLDFYLELQSEQSSHGDFVSSVPSPHIEVVESASEQTFTVHLPREALDTTLALLREKMGE